MPGLPCHVRSGLFGHHDKQGLPKHRVGYMFNLAPMTRWSRHDPGEKKKMCLPQHFPTQSLPLLEEVQLVLPSVLVVRKIFIQDRASSRPALWNTLTGAISYVHTQLDNSSGFWGMIGVGEILSVKHLLISSHLMFSMFLWLIYCFMSLAVLCSLFGGRQKNVK